MATAYCDELIDLIYDAPFEQPRWVRVMEVLNDRVGCYAASLTQLDIVRGTGTGLTARVDPGTMDDYLANWSASNPLLIVDDPVAYARSWTPRVVRAEEWIEEESLRKTSYFNEFLKPLEADFSLIVRLGLHDRYVTTINIGRPDRRGRIEPREMDIVRHYHPHLIRAMKTTQALALSQQALDQLDVTLEYGDKTLFFIDRRGAVRRVSARAEALLSAGTILRLADHCLHAVSGKADQQLQMLVANGAGSMTLPCRNGGAPRELSITPLGPRSTALFSLDPLRLVSISEPEASIALPSLEKRFGLTAAEARVARGLLAGHTLKDIARQSSVSLSTVRVQLSVTFSKMGVNRQSELVRALLEAGYRSDG